MQNYSVLMSVYHKERNGRIIRQGPQFSGTHMAQVGAVVAAVGAPVFLLPAGVAGGAVDQWTFVLLLTVRSALLP